MPFVPKVLILKADLDGSSELLGLQRGLRQVCVCIGVSYEYLHV